MPTEAQIKAAASAIANTRAARRGAPAVTNVLDMLKVIKGGKLYDEVMEDAKAALTAAENANQRDELTEHRNLIHSYQAP